MLLLFNVALVVSFEIVGCGCNGCHCRYDVWFAHFIFCSFMSVILLPTLHVLKSYAAVLKYLLCLTVIVGLLLLLYTIDDARCVMVWCESYVVVMDQFCEIDFVSAKVTEQELQNPV